MAVLKATQPVIKSLLVNPIGTCSQKTFLSYLTEIGRFSKPKLPNVCYETGQLFVNKLFDYRGIIINPRAVKVYDRDLTPDTLESSKNEEVRNKEKKVKSSIEYYYQVFIDARDRYLMDAQVDYINYGSDMNDHKGGYHSVPGLDCVAHEDILPYSGVEKLPFHHELINMFFTYKYMNGSLTTVCNPSFFGTEMLDDWSDSLWRKLKISQVHKSTTNSIRTTVIPYFMGSHKINTNNIYYWRYNVRFHNLSDSAVTVKSHSWKVYSQYDVIGTADGVGVMGQELVLDKTNPVFQYTGHLSLRKPYGRVTGLFTIIKHDESSFDILIPSFPLNS